MSTNSREAMLAAFEAWARAEGLDLRTSNSIENDSYRSPETIAALAAWTASRQQAMEEAAKAMECRASNVRRSNTCRGKVNHAAEFAADQLELGASTLRRDAAASIREAGKE